MTNHNNQPGIPKRLLVALYDSLLVLATIFIASALTLPFTKGEAVHSNIFMSLYLLAVIFVFFGWFWTHGGQTLGMRAWKMKLIQPGQEAVSWKQALIRFLSGLPSWSLFLFGLIALIVPDKIQLIKLSVEVPEWLITLLGFLWICFDNRANNWRDRLSKTHLVFTEEKK